MSNHIEYRATTPVPVTIRRTVMEGRTHRLVRVGEGAPGAVCAVRNGDGIMLGRHLRPVDGREHWEMPRGMGRAGETPMQAACREFLEETGGILADPVEIGRIHADTGILDDDIRIIAGHVGRWTGEGDGELRSLTTLLPAEVDRLIAEGMVDDGITLAAWAAARLTLW